MIQTYTGKFVDPLNLKHEDIEIRDIAHALALINRFNGHSRIPCSVGHHSIFVCELVRTEHKLQALLHDATEAYLGDITKWLKQTKEFSAYREAEDRAWRVISEVFGVPYELSPEVESADKFAVRIEAYYLFGPEMAMFQRSDYPLPTEQELEFANWTSQGNWNFTRTNFRNLFLALTGK
jgi:hypothetical protein